MLIALAVALSATASAGAAAGKCANVDGHFIVSPFPITVNTSTNFNNNDSNSDVDSLLWEITGADTTGKNLAATPLRLTFTTPGYFSATLSVSCQGNVIKRRVTFAVTDPTLPNGGLPTTPPTGTTVTDTGNTESTAGNDISAGDDSNPVVDCPSGGSCVVDGAVVTSGTTGDGAGVGAGTGTGTTGSGTGTTGAGTGAGAAVSAAVLSTAGGNSATAGCVVPKLKGKTIRKAKSLIARSGCKLGKIQRKALRSRSARSGRVFAQSVRAGKRLAKGSKIKLVVAK